MNTISRRQFLQLASGLGLAIAIDPINLNAASDSTLNEVWQGVNDTPLLFEVTDYGTLSVADYPAPTSRRGAFNIDSWWDQSPEDLALATASCTPLLWFAADLHRAALDEKLESIDESLHQLLGCEAAVQKSLAAVRENWGDSDCPSVVQEWLENLEQKDFDSVVAKIDIWLDAEPNWTHEYEYFDSTADGQGAALDFFRSMDLKSIAEIKIKIIEGEHPGSSYYAAELAMDPDEASAIAAREGIPIRFRREG